MDYRFASPDGLIVPTIPKSQRENRRTMRRKHDGAHTRSHAFCLLDNRRAGPAEEKTNQWKSPLPAHRSRMALRDPSSCDIKQAQLSRGIASKDATRRRKGLEKDGGLG